MGVVQRVFDPAIGREVALKLLLADQADPAQRARFLREARVTGQLEHPAIVPVHEVGTSSDGRPFFTMKRIQGESLGTRLERVRASLRAGNGDALAELPLVARLDVLAKVGEALAFAHAQQIVHRDLKPDNVMIGRFGEVQVMDWGLAKRLDGEEPASSAAQAVDDAAGAVGKTLDGDVMGTPAYMPPEQAQGDVRSIDARSDVYSLGAVLYELLTLTPPHQGTSIHELLERASAGVVEPAARRARRTWKGRLAAPPVELAAIAQRAMAPHPADRYAGVEAMLADLARYRAHEPVLAHRDGPVARAAKWTRRHPTTALGGGVALAGVLVALLLAAQLRASKQGLALLEAQARRQEAEAEGARQAESRARADAARGEVEAESARQRALLAEAAEAATKGELTTVRRLLVAKATSARDARWDAFARIMDERHAAGLPDERIAAEVDKAQIDDAIAACDALFAAAEAAHEPLDAEDWYRRAILRGFAKGDFRGACGDLDRAIELAPDRVLYHSNRALVRRTLGDLTGAVADLDRAIALAPAQAYLHFKRGVLREDVRDVDGAAADYARATELAPTDAGAWSNLGNLRLKRGDAAGACAHFTRAIDLAPKDPVFRCNRGLARERAGDLTGARDDYDHAIELNASHATAWSHRAKLRSAGGDHQGALADFDRAVALAPDRADFRHDRAVERGALGQTAGALEDLERALALAPALWQSRVVRGLILRKTEPARALADFAEAYRTCPEDATRAEIAGWMRELGGEPPR